MGRRDLHIVRHLQVVARLRTPSSGIPNGLHRKRAFGSLPRDRGGPRLRKGRARGPVPHGRNRFHPVRPFLRRPARIGWVGVRNFLGAFGHVAMDYIVSLRHLPSPNTSIEILDRQRYFGGTAGNLARAAARLGVKVSLASFVGADFPPDYRQALAKEGVDTNDLRTIPRANTPTAWVFSDPKGNQIAVVDQGPMKDAGRLPLLRHSVQDVDLVHLGTGRPEYYLRIAKLASALRKTITFDPSQEIHYVYTPRLFRELLRRSTYFFGNEAEIVRARRLARVTSTEGLLQAAEVVVVTLGSRGSVIYSRDGRIRIPRVRPRKVVDVTGAGDAYRAGFYAGLSRGLDLRRCGILASAVASFVVEKKGTQSNLPTWSQVLGRARHHATF